MEKAQLKSVFDRIGGALYAVYKKRRRTLFFQKAMWLITGLFFVLLLANMLPAYFPDTDWGFLSLFKRFQATQENPYANTYPFIGLMVLLYPTLFFFTHTFKKFKLKERETISRMVKLLFPQVEFTQSTAVPSREIEKSGLFAWAKTETPMYSYGQIRSKENNTTVNIADVGIVEDNVGNKLMRTLMSIPGMNILVILYQYILKNIVSKKAADNIHYTFRGMFCWLPYPKKLKGHTVVLTNNQSTKLDRWASFKLREEEKIVLEDPRFRDHFVVYGTDQVEARYVLSTALMERIVNLREKFDRTISLSFHTDQMYLAVENANGLFAFPSGKLDDLKVVEELANDIETALNVANDLKLGARR